MEFHWNLLVWMDFTRSLCSSSIHWFSFSVRSLRCSLLFVLLFFSSLHSGSTVSHSDKWVGWLVPNGYSMDVQWAFRTLSGFREPVSVCWATTPLFVLPKITGGAPTWVAFERANFTAQRPTYRRNSSCHSRALIDEPSRSCRNSTHLRVGALAFS